MDPHFKIKNLTEFSQWLSLQGAPDIRKISLVTQKAYGLTATAEYGICRTVEQKWVFTLEPVAGGFEILSAKRPSGVDWSPNLIPAEVLHAAGAQGGILPFLAYELIPGFDGVATKPERLFITLKLPIMTIREAKRVTGLKFTTSNGKWDILSFPFKLHHYRLTIKALMQEAKEVEEKTVP